MLFIAPLAFILGFLAIPIILLYMLRLRRREQAISSTLLWQALARDQSANAPWQRLRRNVFLLLQLLILAALVLALARPYILSADPVAGHVFVLLDASASMTATDGTDGRSRFDEAVSLVNRMIDDIGGGDRMTLIIASDSPAVAAAATNDRALLSNALAAAAPRLTSADWPAAFALVNGSLQGTENPRIVIVSDGGLPDDLPPLAGEISFIPIGGASDNIAISVLGNRTRGERAELLVGTTNFGPTDSAGLLSIYLDGHLYDSRRVEMPSGGEETLNWTLPANTAVVEANLAPIEGSRDYFAADNQAWSLPDNGSAISVNLITEGNQFLERFFAIYPGFDVTRVNEDDPNLIDGERPHDIYVFDGVIIPPTLPPGNILIFDPQPSASPETNPQISVTEPFTNTQLTRMADDPRLTNVLWDDVNIAQARQVQGAGLTPLIESEGGPLLLAGEIDGRRIAVFPFDLASSDLPLRIAFPVIMANIIEWLQMNESAGANGNVEPGAVVTFPPHPRAETVRVEMPGGDAWTRSGVGHSGPILFDQTTRPGLYSVNFYDETGELIQSGQFVVNFFNPRESQIAPSEAIRVGENEVLSDNEETRGRRDLWAIFLGVGLLLISFEWWLSYHRGLNRFLLKSK